MLNSQLQLYYYSAVATSGVPWQDRWVQAHQVLKEWDELQATRDNRLTNATWAALYAALNGTDAAATMESTMLFQNNQTGTWKTWNLTSLTQKWLNGTATNYGVILWATNEDIEAHDLRFYSRENATNQPKLVVTWSNTQKTVYFLKDHLGSTRVTVDQTGAVVGYDDYDPWGYALVGRTQATQWTTLQAVSKNKFTGKEWDNEYGLNWFSFPARPYDPEIARWFILDPATNKFPGWSPYNYSLNNPLKYVDRDGKIPILIIGAAIAGAFIADAIFADPANAPSSQDVAKGNVYEGKSDAQFAVEQGVGASLGAFGAKLLGRAVSSLAGSFTDEAANAAAQLGSASDEVVETAAPQFAKVLEGHGANQGFSGAYDAASGKINIRPSPNQRGAPIPEGGVPRGGGHLIVSSQLGGSKAAHSGFTVIVQKDGTLAVTWKSTSLNKTQDALVSKDLRPQIVKAIEEQTGRKVSSF